MKTRGLLLVAVCVVLPASSRAQVVEYYHLDALGSVRAVTDQAGTVIERHDFYAYGEECTSAPCGTQPGTNTKKFTGKERDSETGLDYFEARYYGSKIGRFTTIDPVMTIDKNIPDPERWNRYGYARGNPFRYVDPDGRELNLTIFYNTGISKERAYAVAKGVGEKFTNAGVLNVTVTVMEGRAGFWATAGPRYNPFDRKSHVLELRNGSMGGDWTPDMRYEGGENMQGGFSAVDVSQILELSDGDPAAWNGVISTAAHEVAHDAVGMGRHTEEGDLMQYKGVASQAWRHSPNINFLSRDVESLRSRYNGWFETARSPGNEATIRP